MPTTIHEIDPETGEILGSARISTSPEDRGEQDEPQSDEAAAFEAAVAARVAAELAAVQAAAAGAAPVRSAADIEAEAAAEAAAAALAKANAAAEHEAKIAAKVAEKVAEAKARQEALDREAQKPNGADAAAAAAAAPAATGKPGRQVTKPPKPATEVAISDELMAMFEADAGRGLDFKPDDLAIPRLYLLQDMSPQVKPRSPDYVDGARAGMWFNTVTGQVLPSVTVVPIKYQRRYVAWRPRLDNGGGGGLVRPDVPYEEFMGYEATGFSVRSYRDDKGLVEVVDTPEWIFLLLPDPATGAAPMPVAMSFPKTKARVAATINSICTMQVRKNRATGAEYEMPGYSNVFRMTQKVDGEGQQSYFVPVAEHLGTLTRTDYFVRAKRLYEQFTGIDVVNVADVGAAEQV